MRVLLTGATGFVGSHIRRRLVADGHEVTGMARGAARMPPETGVTWLAGDVTQPGPWGDEVGKHDAVIHLVAIRRGSRREFRRVVVGGTRALLGQARGTAVQRFLLMSANGAQHGKNAYADAKASAEDLVHSSGIPSVVFRPSFIFGEPPRDAAGRPTAQDFFLEVAGLLRKMPAFPIFGRGDYRVAPVFARDLAQAFSRALTDPVAVDRVWHLCGPRSYTYEELIRQVASWTGKKRWMPHVPVPLVRAGTATLGWIPGFPLTTTELDLLVQGNTCGDDPWVKAFGLSRLTPMEEVVPRYV